MVNGGESFWSCVYAPFMARDLTRDDLRTIVRKGLERTSGNYKVMVELFNMPADDYKRFLGFLRKYQCHMPFQQFRSAATQPRRGEGRAAATAGTHGRVSLTRVAYTLGRASSSLVGDRAASAARRSRPA